MNKTLFAHSLNHKIIILIVVALCVLIEVFPIYGYTSDIDLPKTLSYVLSIFSLGVVLLSLYFFNNEFSLSASSYKSKALLSIYLLLILANPVALIFSTYHILAILIIWVLYFNAKFYFSERNKSSFFITILLSSIASLVYPPLFWLSIIIFIAAIFYSKLDILRLFAIFLAALILPFIYMGFTLYFFWGANILQYLSEYFIKVVDVHLFSAVFRVEHIVYIVVLLLILLNVTLNFQKRLNGLRPIQRAAYRVCFIFMFSLLFIFTVFRNSEFTPLGLILYLPISLVFYNYLNHNLYKGWSKMLVILIILLVIMYRATFYLDLLSFL